ncbi:hypothetical protein AI2688V1_5133 (plasmid) [Enterobacter cloacae]|nr:hypothetical protein AI2688V1_5133 [Enterobacter cloacae]CAH3992673.1 hypothetical protein AI2688V1_5133 [Enterobacter cloacae]
MIDLYSFIKLTAAVIGICAASMGFAAFILWQNPFRFIKTMLAVRILVALVAYAWVLYFIQR